MRYRVAMLGLVLATALGCDSGGGGPADVAPSDTSALEDLAAPQDLAGPQDLADPQDLAAPQDLATLQDSPGPADVAAPDDAPPPPDTAGGDDGPILERTPRLSYSCRVERAATSHAPRTWGIWGPALASTVGGTAFLARSESAPPDPFTPAPTDFVVSSLAVDGTFGAPVEPSSGDGADIDSPALARRGDGVAVVWAESGTLRFAALDADGQVLVAARTLTGATADVMSRPRLASGPDGGFGLVYAPMDATSVRDVHVLTLEADGTPRGAPRVLATGRTAWYDPAPAITADDEGYAVLWRERDEVRGTLRFSALAADGTERVAPRDLTVNDNVGRDVGFESGRLALLAIGGGYVAAWTEGSYGDMRTGMGGGASVLLARVDGAGSLVGSAAPLRAFEDGIDEVEPSLVPFGDGHVAVLWGRGTHISICGGCFPDNGIHLVVLDPADLVPVSDVATMPCAPVTGGLMRHVDAVVGSSILTAFQITFHVSQQAGSGAFTCD